MSEIDQNIFHSIQQLSRQLTKRLNEVLQPHGLFSAQWTVLFTLKKYGTLTQTELCDYLSIEAPPMTRTIQRLVKQGYVLQTPGSDKRTKHIKLTDKAINDYALWEKSVLEMENDLLKGIPDDMQAPLRTYIQQWLQHIRKTERR
ncbi:MarR family transcriptional regulator [Metabacillus idriensis]|uniref:Winged helix DNA-binding protein n=1 Tax=Metabacillus idriensis TaxID=324768 RepID=A0A6I2M8C4_9BACI|nr:MarR family transcriptional regulator [Metabacillus idriensis]MCM3598633.1 MarR family transcriptional regulator [Metabacillus idriensis]MRX54470.1 winged helix DNA-binding protein [Metabacillus idriensis]OHR65860.1 MarR family transcriptional regulator [Bacillus sp. HMSC76G11]